MNWTSNMLRDTAALAAFALTIGCGGGDDPPAQDTRNDRPASPEIVPAAQLVRATPPGEQAGETDAPGADEPATGWRVDLYVDHPADTMGNALSPVAPAPAALADSEGDFTSEIRYLCLNSKEREMGNVAPVMLRFGATPRMVAREGGEAGQSNPVELRTTWGEETVAMNAYASRRTISFDQEDAAGRGTGESSNAEVLRRLLESGSTAGDALVIGMDWQDVGPVSYTYSLEGAAAAIREAGLPCGVG